MKLFWVKGDDFSPSKDTDLGFARSALHAVVDRSSQSKTNGSSAEVKALKKHL